LRNYSTVLYFILRLRQLCNDVALCPLDMKLWLPTDSLEGMPSINILISGTVI
jgi:SWI/SNF-related matrix-associated actin-dependent regulator of chromatin subfamily A3